MRDQSESLNLVTAMRAARSARTDYKSRAILEDVPAQAEEISVLDEAIHDADAAFKAAGGTVPLIFGMDAKG